MERQRNETVVRHIIKGGVALGLALTLAACTSSQRFGSSRGTNPPPAGYTQPDSVEAIPSGPISSEPLAPLPGTAPADGMGYGGGQTVAGVNPSAPTPSAPAPANRMGMVGGWTAKDATGASCRVVLSSAPTLDLYRASSSGCTNKDLSNISAWDFRGGEVYLYQTGGTLAARLRAQGSNMDGALTKSGAPLSMSR